MLSVRSFLLTISSALLIHNVNALNNQSTSEINYVTAEQELSERKLSQQELSQRELSQQKLSQREPQTKNKDFGVTDFLSKTFNHPLYARETLPCHLHDLQALLNQGRIVPNPVPYSKALFKLFGNKIKGAPYVSAYGLLELLEQLPTSLDYLKELKPIDVTSAHYYDELHNLLYDAFLTKFDDLKANPNVFFTMLTNNVVTLVSKNLTKPMLEITRNETLIDLQPVFVRFLDTTINKLMWNTKEAANIWITTKGIATELESLYDKEFISDLTDLDDLYWTLIHRFALFLDLSANKLPLELLHEMHNEVVSGNLVFLSIAEQEPYLETKKYVLERALTGAISKRLSYEHDVFIA
jgi:hypothetical protein